MKTIIAGCRHYKSFRPFIIAAIEEYFNSGEITEVLCGMAEGADLLGKQLAEYYKIPVKEYPAQWKNFDLPYVKIKTNDYGKYNALAGMWRNQKMAEDADFLIAIWDGKSKGTKDMIDRMKKLKKPYIILKQESEN